MTRWSWRQSAGLLSLYGSRVAGIVVALLFLPLYSRLLGAHDFGIVAMILSGQVLMAMLDLGMANLVARDLAATAEPGRALAQWQAAERLLTVYFAALGGVALLLGVGFGLSPWWVTLGTLMYWALTLQNLSQSALLARGQAPLAATLQGLGTLGRACLTAATLMWADRSLQGFLISQAVGAVLHLLASRHFGQGPMVIAPSITALPTESLRALARRGLPLFLVGIAGAAVLQLDKLIIGVFMSPAAVAPYFLATTFCMTPVSILAGPVAQYFQPQVISAVTSGDAAAAQVRARQLTLALLASVVLPTLLLWVLREPLIRFWLHDPALSAEVARLCALLLPAAAVGAIGNVPLTLLNAVADFRSIARISALCTTLTLAGVAVMAQREQLQLVCAVYLGYYMAVTLLLWWRAAQIRTTARAALRSGWLTSGGVAAAAVLIAITTYATAYLS